jgi:PKD repeat protein
VSPSTARLSAGEVTTNAQGEATFTVTAPPPGTLGNFVTVSATPVGTDIANAVSRVVTIGLIGVSNSTAPNPSFTVTPPNPQVRQITTFDASATTDEGGPCGSACTYRWDFDDGSTGSGQVVTHAFEVGRLHTVTLTVTDAAGLTAQARQTVTVAAVSAPTVANPTVIPLQPVVGQPATFTANATPAAGHSIRTWEWNFGDGTSAETTGGPTVSHTFSALGTFNVSVTVTDDLGQTGRAATSVTVTSGITFPSPPNPVFTVSPDPPRVGQAASFNATGVTGASGAAITEYTWDFGDGSAPVTRSEPTVTHTFNTDQAFVVRLTVKDSSGRTDSRTRTVDVE